MICSWLSWFYWKIICNCNTLCFLSRIILFHVLLLNILQIFAAGRRYFLFCFLFLLNFSCFLLIFLHWDYFLSKFFNFLLELQFILLLGRNFLILRIKSLIITNMTFFSLIIDLLRIMEIKYCTNISMLILNCWNDWLLKFIDLIACPYYSSTSSCCYTLTSFMIHWRYWHWLSCVE